MTGQANLHTTNPFLQRTIRVGFCTPKALYRSLPVMISCRICICQASHGCDKALVDVAEPIDELPGCVRARADREYGGDSATV